MGLREGTPATILRADYQPPNFCVSRVALEVSIFEGRTEVIAALTVERKTAEDAPLRLDGEQLELQHFVAYLLIASGLAVIDGRIVAKVSRLRLKSHP
mgnify:CR=1 FL=1